VQSPWYGEARATPGTDASLLLAWQSIYQSRRVKARGPPSRDEG
jgi:hypothetical protein